MGAHVCTTSVLHSEALIFCRKENMVRCQIPATCFLLVCLVAAGTHQWQHAALHAHIVHDATSTPG
jgi:hypothetical protein